MSPQPPSGAQHRISHGVQAAIVTEVGATLRSYTVADAELLDGFAEDEMCSGARGEALLPWPNRIADGAYDFDGEHYELALTEPARRNAIHGLTRWCNWIAAERSDTAVAMEYILHAQSGYPFVLGLRVEYRLDDEGLSVTTTARNLGARRAPYGAGFHPYLRLGTPRIDPLTLCVPADTRMETDDRGIPTGTTDHVDGGEYDFRSARPIADTKLDTAYCDLRRDADGRARVVLADPSDGRAVALWMDERHPYLMIFTGDGLPQPDKRRTGLGVEPMTCAPDAFRNHLGLQVLEPGEAFTSSWGITPP